MIEDAGIYVHVPFCLTRCGYCDFNAYAGLDELQPRYLRALLAEAELASPGWNGTRFVSVFLGGGTPTTMAPADLRALLVHLRDRFDVVEGAEVTIEANPDTVDASSLASIRDAGYDRLSMGAQSFDPAVLASLERLHEPASVRAAMGAARRAGYDNVNLDLIYGTDGETLESWERTLREAIALAPEHVSAYALTIEPATPLGRQVAAGSRPAPDPDVQADMFQAACELLRDAGYHHYEVSNWAKPGFECRHNLGYWERRPYVGLGAGAHAYRDDVRWWNVRPPETYLEQVEAGELPIGGSESLDPADAYLEEVFLKLRILEGVPASWFEPDRFEAFVASGLLTDEVGQLVPTERGMLLLNELVLGLTG
jgi:putative oxygen-independent coproporphyrinogen III oxidase